jgi:hypothetical protein
LKYLWNLKPFLFIPDAFLLILSLYLCFYDFWWKNVRISSNLSCMIVTLTFDKLFNCIHNLEWLKMWSYIFHKFKRKSYNLKPFWLSYPNQHFNMYPRCPDGNMVAVFLKPSGHHRGMAALWPDRTKEML